MNEWDSRGDHLKFDSFASDKMDDTENSNSEDDSVYVDIRNVKFEFVKCEGKEDKPFPGPLYTHGLFKYHKNWDNLSKKNGTGNMASYECSEHRASGCLAKAKVKFERREDSDGNIEMLYELYQVAKYEDHTCIPDPTMIIADQVRENMKREVRKDPWGPVSHIYNRIMNEQVYQKYDEDIVTGVDSRMGRRPEGFLQVLQQKLTGGRPTNRDTWDPTHALNIVTGGDNVIVLDSHNLPDGWENEDLGEKINNLRKPRDVGHGRFDTDTGSEGSGASSQVDVMFNIFGEPGTVFPI